jgi:hypothetical protein
MNKIVLVLIAFAAVTTTVCAQNKKKINKAADLTNRAGDHVMLQFGLDRWAGVPDSIKSNMKGFSKAANIYVMMNKPFKNNPQFSFAFGAGFGTSNVFFKNYSINIKSTAAKLPFTALDSSDRFKKYKLTTVYLEIPVELRYTSNAAKNKSVKIALGVKVGTLLNAHTKGKTLQNQSGATINAYTEKESSKRFFNSTRIAGIARIGYGNFSVFGSYQFTNLLKDGVGPDLKPFQIGLCLSGL